MAQATRYYPLVEAVLLTLIPPSLKKKQQDHYNLAVTKIHRRMNLETKRYDLMTPVLKRNKDYHKMSIQEIESTYALLILVGSESIATSLSGIVNCLLQNPTEMLKLTNEIRNAFKNKSEIAFATVKELPFLNAVIREGLRLCNPLAGGVPRMVPSGGKTVCGHFLPEDVRRCPCNLQRILLIRLCTDPHHSQSNGHVPIADQFCGARMLPS